MVNLFDLYKLCHNLYDTTEKLTPYSHPNTIMKQLHWKPLTTSLIAFTAVLSVTFFWYYFKQRNNELSVAYSQIEASQNNLHQQQQSLKKQSQQLEQTAIETKRAKEEQESLKQHYETLVTEYTQKQRDLDKSNLAAEQNLELAKRKHAEAQLLLKRYKHAKEAAEDQRRALYITKKKGDKTISETMSALQLSQLEAKNQQKLAELAQQSALARSEEAQLALEQLPYLHAKISSLEAEVSRLRHSNVFLTKRTTRFKHKSSHNHTQLHKKNQAPHNSSHRIQTKALTKERFRPNHP